MPLSRHALPDHLSPILHDCCGTAAHIGVALSGGADSMALALLMRDWCSEYGVKLTTLTVDHRLRAESADEAKQVAQWMHAQNIAHAILTPVPNASINNTQARARDMRYRAMTQWCSEHGAMHLLVAQHYDDQAETVALQQHRGESPPSRAGMALCRTQDGVRLVRPLLGVRKQTLIRYLQEHDQPWVEDPSNQSDAYARNRLRDALPNADALWQQAQHMGEQRHAQEVLRNAWFAQHAADNIDLTAWRALDVSLRLDYLSRAIQRIGGKAHRARMYESTHLAARILEEASGKATLGHCIIMWDGTTLRITRERPLEPALSGPYMASPDSPNALVSEPFWWFNYPPYNDGASCAPAK